MMQLGPKQFFDIRPPHPISTFNPLTLTLAPTSYILLPFAPLFLPRPLTEAGDNSWSRDPLSKRVVEADTILKASISETS